MVPDNHPYLLTPFDPQPWAPLLVFFPGLDGSGELFYNQAQSLRKHFDLRCLTIPNHNFMDWSELTEASLALISQELQDAQRPAYLCGESFGGCLALLTVLMAPQLFSHLVLVNPASSLRHRPWIGWGAGLTQGLPEPVYKFSSTLLIPWLAALPRLSKVNREALLARMQAVDPATCSWRISLLQKFQVSPAQLARLSLPVLVVVSEKDRLLPSVKEAQTLAQAIPQLYQYFLPDSGHACLLEQEVDLGQILGSMNLLPTPAKA